MTMLESKKFCANWPIKLQVSWLIYCLLGKFRSSDLSEILETIINLDQICIELITNYQNNGLPNAPTLPLNIPGFGSVMRTPDKVLRAELSMLQDLIRMAQKMTQNPISATIDVPKG